VFCEKINGKKWKKRTKIRVADNKQKKAFRIREKIQISSKREGKKLLRLCFLLFIIWLWMKVEQR